MTEKRSITLPGTVERIIKLPNEREKAQITVKGDDLLYREIRIDNTLRNEDGDNVSLIAGAQVEVVVGAECEAGSLPPSKAMEKASPPRAPMNKVTLSSMAQTKPSEPLLEHEIRLRAFDLYDRRGRMDGHSLEDWLQAEAEMLGQIFSHSG